MSYSGVYSSFGAGTNIGTEVNVASGKITSVTSKEAGRQYVTNESLSDANLNVAKIRLVSTLPGKQLDESLRGKAYVGFVLTGVNESHNEKMELVPLPGDSFASYFYGANPRQFTFSGVLLNTQQDKWRDSFEQLYEEHLRGSVSARNFNIVQVSYNGRIVSGWLTNLSQTLDSNNDHYAMLTFSVLVSRVDMSGGSKQYLDYLVTLGDDNNEFSSSKIDTDYAVLDPTNYNGMIDPIRTGMVIPPKRPHKARGRKKRTTPDCWFPVDKTTAGKTVNNGALTANDHINDATVCSVIANIEGTALKIKELQKQAKELLKDKANGDPPSSDDIEESEKLQIKARALAAELRRKRKDKDIQAAVAAEAKATLQAYAKAAKETDAQGEPTDRAKRAKAAIDSGTIRVGDAATLTGVTQDSAGTLNIGSKDDPNLYDGEKEERWKRAEEEYYNTEDKTKGLVPEAKARRKARNEADKEKRRQQAAKAAAAQNTRYLDGS